MNETPFKVKQFATTLDEFVYTEDDPMQAAKFLDRLWNTVYLERAVQAIREAGKDEAGKDVDATLLQHLSPLGWEHINLTGDYIWQQSRPPLVCRRRGSGRPQQLLTSKTEALPSMSRGARRR